MKSQQTSLDRGLRLLMLLHEHGEQRLGQLIDGLHSSRATVFRALSTLQAHGFVEHDRSARTYRLGPALRSSQPEGLTQAVTPALHDLVERTGETAGLAIVQGRHIRYAAVVEGTFAVRFTARAGDEVPPHAGAAGKAILTALTSAQRDRFLGQDPYPSYTPRTLIRRAPLEWELETVRDRGYAVDDQETEIGVRGVGAAILDGRQRPVAAIVVAAPSTRLSQAELPVLGGAIVEWCERVAGSLVRSV